METWFKYTALSQSNCTRIIFLHAASATSEPLECTLEERLLDDDNRVSGEPFAALSYTWGRPGSGHYIKYEGKKIPITENCDAALRHIRSIAEEQPQALWVDAICIDQSNVDERSLQVQIFHHIYASAERTWVWLGEKTQHTEHAVKLLLMANSHGLHLFQPRNYQPVIFHDAQGFKDRMLEVADTAGLSLEAILSDIFNRSWWCRMWTLQEIIISKNPVVLIGDLQIPWDFFGRVGADLVQFAVAQLHLAVKAHSFLSLAEPVNKFGDKKADIIGPEKILLACAGQESTDPRDRIFALYWMLTRWGWEFPKPDYTKSVLEVFQDAMVAILKDKPGIDSLEILCLIHPKRRLVGAPSWVVNFGAEVEPFPALDYSVRKPYGIEIDIGFMKNSQAVKKYDGAAWRGNDIGPVLSGNMMVLSCKILGDITHHTLSSSLGKPQMDSITEASDLETKTCILRRWVERLASGTGDVVHNLATIVRAISFPISDDDLDWYELFAKWYKEMLSCSELQLYLESQYPAEVSESLAAVLKQDSPLLVAKGILLALEKDEELFSLHRYFARALDYYELFLTDTCHQGAAARGIKEGDQIALLPSCSHPMVIRRVNSDCFELVAPAFVAGIMDGETWSEDEPDLEALIFV